EAGHRAGRADLPRGEAGHHRQPARPSAAARGRKRPLGPRRIGAAAPDRTPRRVAGALAVASRAGNNDPPPIIVKKVIVQANGGHHGGAWKVAYADFVTAMMAFFLLLWLLGSTTEAQRRGLADYFTPTLVKLREQSAGSNGFLGGASLTDPDNYPHRAAQTGKATITVPREASGGKNEGASPMKRMRERLERRVAADPRLRKLMRQVRMVDTTEGTRIDLVDDADFSMFSLGTTVLTPDARTLLGAIAATIAPESGLVTIR